MIDFDIIESKKNAQFDIKAKLGLDLLKGHSPCLKEIKKKICIIAPYNVNVLICGHTGSGKELTAQLIHFLSSRSQKPFVPINCGAIPKDLFENELFGHKKGAYTHAQNLEKGLISAANTGTLFLDEVESLPESMQVKLLRFLEDKKYKPLGQSNYLSADVRVIAAAKENLWKMVVENKFRADLFYRLNVVQICLPALRERCEDVPILAKHFVDQFSAIYNKQIVGISQTAIQKLIAYDWPGNVRELENVIQQAVIFTQNIWIEPKDLNLNSLTIYENNELGPFRSAKQWIIRNFEQNYLRKIMALCKGNITHAAKFAQQDRRAFNRLLKKHNINPVDFRK